MGLPPASMNSKTTLQTTLKNPVLVQSYPNNYINNNNQILPMTSAILAPRCRRWRVYLAPCTNTRWRPLNQVSTINNIAFRYTSLYSVFRLSFNIHSSLYTIMYLPICYLLQSKCIPSLFKATWWFLPHPSVLTTRNTKSPCSPLDISSYLSVVVNN